jgi:fumarylacetoacetase
MSREKDTRSKSFIEAANSKNCPFPIENLPYGIFSTQDGKGMRAGVAIGDFILDLAAIEAMGVFTPDPARRVFENRSLNAFMELGPRVWTATRSRIAALLDAGNHELRDNALARETALLPLSSAALHLPFTVAGFTDFYSSREHATNAGSMFRGPENALPPNWLHLPIAYNGRASSVCVSGTPVRRPMGQIKPAKDSPPIYGPCRKLDFELEVGTVIGQPSQMGRPISATEAADLIFGYVLLNDWSARDIQQWESTPLGPFQGKVFATSISPWVVTREALKPFRIAGPAQEPEPLPYLRQAEPRNFDIHLEVALRPGASNKPSPICETNFKYMYWSSVQQAVHHAAGGCNFQCGDLLGSGTISGPAPSSFGSMLELTWNGARPITLDEGIQRRFLEDGDKVIMTGWCQAGALRIGFGEVSAEVLPAVAP